ncbi:MAG TPA: DNA/RNA non-specific endonuclease, partial [Roseiflexaceae bacterium]|nr:DNA/RNA non-specific endonuclease [Roseiflexaceae bacterium]
MPIRRVRWFWLVLLLALLALGGITPTRAGTPNVHLLFGNPSGAVTDPTYEDNYLIERAQYALAYRRADGIPRWVSWHLAAADIGPAPRCDCFTADTSLPSGWNRVVSGDYTNSGYDRGHMTPSEDRTATDADNAATFLMTNIVPQTPANNRGPWAYLERDSRILAQAGNELAIISGPVGTLGTLAGGTVRVPAATWKGVLVLPAGAYNPAKVTTATRVIAIRTPNDASVQQSDD